MTPNEFQTLIAGVTEKIAGRPVGPDLVDFLNQEFPADGELFSAIERACHDAIEAGWMCDREAGGIRFGRVIKPGPETHGFSVDVVHMREVKGPHHRHPNGEIDMIMPIDSDAKFDGHPRGWCVYGPDSAHHPTVSGGEALVLYLLPDGKIEFTR
ncbi:MAG: hypothetical protein Kow006_14890 [Gammaproteobacteria bacterium]